MASLELTEDFDTTKEELLQLVTDTIKAGETLDIDIPIMGELYYTDSEELASELLYAAYIGESIAGTCRSFTCQADLSSVEFSVVPADAEAFVSALWDAITGFLSEELLDEEGMDEISVAERRQMGDDFPDHPELAPHTQEVVELAREVLSMAGDEDEDEENEDEDEEEDDEERQPTAGR